MSAKGGNEDEPTDTDSAALGGRLDELREMLRAGAPVTEWAVESAAINGHADCVRALLNAGALYPAHVVDAAAINGHGDVVDALLAAGATFSDAAIDGALVSDYDDVVASLISHRELWIETLLPATAQDSVEAVAFAYEDGDGDSAVTETPCDIFSPHTIADAFGDRTRRDRT